MPLIHASEIQTLQQLSVLKYLINSADIFMSGGFWMENLKLSALGKQMSDDR